MKQLVEETNEIYFGTNMTNTPSSIEMQIDNFLEHFKRSASKAMDTEWVPTESSAIYANTTAASFNHSSPLKTTRTRSSCFDISQLGSLSGKWFNEMSTSFFRVFYCFECENCVSTSIKVVNIGYLSEID